MIESMLHYVYVITQLQIFQNMMINLVRVYMYDRSDIVVKLSEQYDFKFICSTNGQDCVVIQYEDNCLISLIQPQTFECYCQGLGFQKVHLNLDYEDDIDYIQFIRDDSLELESLIFSRKGLKRRMGLHGCRPVVFLQIIFKQILV
ncbi:hypothetical protein pb186bvf_005922 [Paramecium bursaria]